MPKPRDKYPYSPNDGLVVSEAESVVRAVQQQFQRDLQRMTREVVGRSGRGFQQVELSPEERKAAFDEMRQVDDPELWGKQLASVQHDPAAIKRLLKSWATHEDEWRKAQNQGVVANFPGASLPQPPPEMNPDAERLPQLPPG